MDTKRLWLILLALSPFAAECKEASDYTCRENRGKSEHQVHAGNDSVRALLALAAYVDCPPTIVLDDFTYLPVNRFPKKGDRAYGLAYTVFDQVASGTGRVGRRVIAYRGTELTHPNDWIFGNFPMLRMQQRIARSRFLDDLDGMPPDAKVTVLGHSLGGGIAVTMYRYFYDEIDRARAFNSSPLGGCIWIAGGTMPCKDNAALRAAPNADERANEWLNTHEQGDPTRIVGNLMFWKWDALTPDDDKRWYRRYDFLDFQVISDHSIQKLTYHLACYAAPKRTDVMAATQAVQCLRKHKGSKDQCQSELAAAPQVQPNECTDAAIAPLQTALPTSLPDLAHQHEH